jgi:hypothetical protein
MFMVFSLILYVKFRETCTKNLAREIHTKLAKKIEREKQE